MHYLLEDFYLKWKRKVFKKLKSSFVLSTISYAKKKKKTHKMLHRITTDSPHPVRCSQEHFSSNALCPFMDAECLKKLPSWWDILYDVLRHMTDVSTRGSSIKLFTSWKGSNSCVLQLFTRGLKMPKYTNIPILFQRADQRWTIKE